MAPGDARHGNAGGVLERTLATTFEVGTNLRGRVAGAAWAFLLPTLDLAHVVCLGLPTEATLQTLCLLAERVDVVPRADERDHARRLTAPRDQPRARLVTPADLADPAVAPDLVVISGGAAPPGADALAARARAVFRDPAHASSADALRLAPASGEVRLAAAAGDGRTFDFLRATDAAPGGSTRLRRLARRVLSRRPSGERVGALWTVAGGAPPAYLVRIAAQAGIDLSGCTVGLSAPSEYASRKVILFLFDAPEATQPRWVVKLTREPRLNARLENESRALSLLQDAGIGDEATLPRTAFTGRHAGLALVGETAVTGDPLRRRTTHRADCPLVAAGLRWLLDLGEQTAAPRPSPRVVADALGRLGERFGELYGLSGAERSRLEELLGHVAAADRVPLVFQHGDPGLWNVLVTADGRPIFLDWEAFEHHGMPLWDALYFARSHAVGVGRAAGAPDALAALRRGWLQDGPLMADLTACVEAHAAAIGLSRDLVEPLFVTCWLHRALKEAGRLTPARMPHGHYATLTRLALRPDGAPGLRRLYGTG